MHHLIQSMQNPRIKFLNQLKEKSRTRRKEHLFLIEGKREIALAISAGYEISELFYCSFIISPDEILQLLGSAVKSFQMIEITLEIYQRLAYRINTEGVIAVAKAKDLALKTLNIESPNPLILVAEAPEKPGNIGALLRTADAAKVDAVLIANPKTDMYNPNIIRSSVGCIFTNTIATGSTAEIIDYLKKNNINIYGAALQTSEQYHKISYKNPCAIVVGTEDRGLSSEWLENTDQNIKIPMSGTIDSLNVSVAAGILIFEAKRQRDFVV